MDKPIQRQSGEIGMGYYTVIRKPDWWGPTRWPAFGPDLNPPIGIIAAQVRWNQSQRLSRSNYSGRIVIFIWLWPCRSAASGSAGTGLFSCDLNSLDGTLYPIAGQFWYARVAFKN